MPISFIPIDSGGLCLGQELVIEDDDELASLVAQVALGQYRLVLKILNETGFEACAAAPTVLHGARKLLTASNPEEPWHRDGWLFQVISWIAANLHNESSIIRAPHMIHAHKGFDGIQVDLDQETGEIVSVVICEDKATGTPRKIIRNDVWTDFVGLEKGDRDNELVADISALLDSRPEIDSDEAVEKIFWSEVRAYRVTITVGDRHRGKAGMRRLFKDYPEIINGDIKRRRGDTLYLEDLRGWMDQMASRALEVVENMESKRV